MGAGPTRALTGGRRTKPTSTGCRRLRQPEPGRRSTYQAGEPVQTNRASSRLTREHGLLAHQRAGHPRGPKAHDGTITTERVDVMWGTDLTSVVTGEGQAAVFVAVDHCSAECVGIHASRGADRFEALEPVRQA